jgi:hypothetical protein
MLKMKRQLLLGATMLTALAAVSQSQSKTFPTNVAEIAKEKYGFNRTQEPGPSSTPAAPRQRIAAEKTAKAASLTINWNSVTSSMNALGVLVSETRSLDYNENLDAVAMIVRRGPHYVMNPAPTQSGALSGGIIGFISTDMGATWDSTLIWNNSTNWARYPQGGIWNPLGPPTNTLLSNAYIVATGPVTPNSGGWVGNFFASKKLDVFNNVADATPGAQQYISSTGPTYDPAVQKVDFARLCFQSTDDGNVRALGLILNDPNSTTNNTPYGFRGARIVKGSFNAGVFNWTSDSVSLANSPVDYDATEVAYNVIGGFTGMAWNEAGTTGYVWFLGTRSATAVTGSNIGYQPIIWKTSNSGQSWSLLPLIDFNSPSYAPILSHLEAVVTPTATGLKVPFFNFLEDITGVVDKNDELHFVSTIMSTRNAEPDSLGYTHAFLHADGQTYRYPHEPGFENYIYDFTTINGGAGWKWLLVDSLETEYVGATGLGNSQNPYTDDKYPVGARLQVSRTPGGEYIIYNWADSKYLFTPNALRWNNRPDLYAKIRHADSTNFVAPKYDLTGFSSAGDVYTSAYMHHASPKSKLSTTTAPNTTVTTIALPVKVTSSNPLVGNTANTHYYASAMMSFTAVSQDTTSVSENVRLAAGSAVYPNPAAGNANVIVTLSKGADIQVSVLNIIGQEVKRVAAPAHAGENNINLSLDGLAKGVYMVNIEADGATATKKLIVE